MLVMIVVPALAEGNQREKKIVAAFIAGLITSVADQVGHRIDRRRGVKQDRRAENESPNK